MARRVTVQRVLAVLVLTASVVLAAQVNPSSFNLTAAKAPETTTTATTAISVTDYPKTWVANLFYETLVNFTVSEDVGNSACRQQTQMYIKHLRNDSFWALQMSDSWSRYPNGILVGTTHQMGVYEECVHVHQPVQGKYCLPSVELQTTTGVDYMIGKPLEPNSYDHAWREILGFLDKNYQAPRNVVKFGICIPDSCTASDLQTSLQREFDKHFLQHQVKAQVQVQSTLCSTDKNTYPYDTGFIVTCMLLGIIFLLCFLSTANHFVNLVRSNNGKKTIKRPEILNLFSIIRNTRDLIKYDKDNELNIFNGLKVITMILVVFGHKFFYFVINPIMWAKRLEMIYVIGPNFLLTCMNLVDPFFFIAGYLMYVLLVPQLNKPSTNWTQVPMIIVYKYLRVLPSYVMMMLLTAFIVPHMGDGPFWASRMWSEADKCKTYWWANLLAVSNFIEVNNQCLIAGWYISCLLQLLVIGTVVMYVYVKNRKIGVYLMVFLLCASMVILPIMTYVHRAYGIVRLLYTTLENPNSSVEFNHLYRPFYYRGIPYYAGLLAGVIVEELKNRKFKFSMFTLYGGTVFVSAVCTWVQLYGAQFYDINRPYNVIEQSLYSTISHCTWTVILFWVTICNFTTGYGPLEKLLNNRLVVPLGRLCYVVYLVNLTVMLMVESRQKVAVSPSIDFLIDGWIFGLLRTYFVGFMLYIFVEAPFGQLIKTLLYGKINKNNERPVTTENPENSNNIQKVSTHL